MLRTRVAREILVCSASSLTNQHCLKGAWGTPAFSPRFSECLHRYGENETLVIAAKKALEIKVVTSLTHSSWHPTIVPLVWITATTFQSLIALQSSKLRNHLNSTMSSLWSCVIVCHASAPASASSQQKKDTRPQNIESKQPCTSTAHRVRIRTVGPWNRIKTTSYSLAQDLDVLPHWNLCKFAAPLFVFCSSSNGILPCVQSQVLGSNQVDRSQLLEI